MSAIPTPVAVFEEFLAPMELDWVHHFVASQENAFQPSQVIGPGAQGIDEPAHRRSRVLYDLGVFHELMGNRLSWFLPHIVYRLGLPLFDIRQIELQLTASGDGEYFRAHTDADDGPVHSRTVTFVLFCHREPLAFSGGELRIYGPDGSELPDGAATVLRPSQNRMIVFPSTALHEVMPVVCPGNHLLDTRLTLNGWLHR